MNLNNKEDTFKKPSVIIVLLVLIFIGGYFLLNKKGAIETVIISNNSQDSQQEEIDFLKEEVEKLKNQQPQTIIKEVEKTISRNTSDELSSIIKKWRPFVAYIECDFRYADGTPIYTSSGSGLLLAGEYGTILTNRHVISVVDKYAPYVCRIQMPDDYQNISIYGSEKDSFQTILENNLDFGVISVSQPTQYMIDLDAKSPSPLNCYPPSIGDKVVILGYPSVGSKQDITATEGIISGFDGDYFITSAKVEEGNSGGIAVSVKEDCYLGIPTYAEVGNVESLARILDFTAIIRALMGQ